MLGKVLEDEGESYEIESNKKASNLPYACYICREPFVNPVVTKCQHYFCESCALKQYAKDTKCFVCKAQTSGIFNTAADILQRNTQHTADTAPHSPPHEEED